MLITFLSAFRHQTRYNLYVPMEDTYKGFVRRLLVKRSMKCLTCKGQDNSCTQCFGKRIFKRVSYVVAFDAGVPSLYTQRIHLSGEEYVPSVLTVTVIEMVHLKYRRDGDDLIMTMIIDFKEALSGFEKVLTTIDNRFVYIKKRPGESTRNKEKMIVVNEGFPIYGDENKKRGDLIIFARILNSNFIKTLPENTFKKLKKGLLPQPTVPVPPATPSFDLVSSLFC